MSHKRSRFSEGLDLSILPDTDTNQPGCASLAKPLALPIALHHRRERRQGAPCLSPDAAGTPTAGATLPAQPVKSRGT
jgi:hypothetical protein